MMVSSQVPSGPSSDAIEDKQCSDQQVKTKGLSPKYNSTDDGVLQGASFVDTTHGEDVEHLPRYLSLLDLLGIGIGGTVGSGIFVLVGFLTAHVSGRATWASFLLAGFAAGLSGMCFAELSCRFIQYEGSTYSYSRVVLGDFVAVIAAASVSLEYGVSGAAVARTWGDKVVEALRYAAGSETAFSFLVPFGIHLPSVFMSIISTIVLLLGFKESTSIVNTLTVLKLVLISFMILGGVLVYFWSEDDSQPSEEHLRSRPNTTSILHGAVSSFFGYLGYDEICCCSAEAKNPVRDLPRAVIGTIGITTSIYVLAALVLAHMAPPPDADSFPSAFRYHDYEWAAKLTAWGEILALPVVVIICLMAQPRLFYQMAQDGLLPHQFSNLKESTVMSGVLMTIISAVIPFQYLDDFIGAGILVAFTLTNCCVLLLRRRPTQNAPMSINCLLIVFNGSWFIACALWGRTHIWFLSIPNVVVSVLALLSMLAFTRPSEYFGEGILSAKGSEMGNSEFFSTPCVPLVPCLAMGINMMLIAQLSSMALLLLIVYFGLAVTPLAISRSRKCKRIYVGVPRDADEGLGLTTIN